MQGDEALLGYSRIYAPIAGTVVLLEARPGQTLNATYQTPNLLRVADLSAMTVWTQVSEADVSRLRVGMEAVFTILAQEGRQWRGTVRQVLPMPQPEPAEAAGGGATQPAVGAKAVFYTVLFDVPNPDLPGPGPGKRPRGPADRPDRRARPPRGRSPGRPDRRRTPDPGRSRGGRRHAPLRAVSALIRLESVGRSYGGAAGAPATRALSDVSLSIREGEYVAIVGASGSGKSTLMHILGCLDRPDNGTYRFEGRDVAALSADERARLRREAFGFVFQGYHLIPTDSALENAALPALYAGEDRAARERRAAGLLERLGMGGRLEHRPAQLSGGQQQRVSIARALANGGRVILADEPTGAVAPCAVGTTRIMPPPPPPWPRPGAPPGGPWRSISCAPP